MAHESSQMPSSSPDLAFKFREEYHHIIQPNPHTICEELVLCMLIDGAFRRDM